MKYGTIGLVIFLMSCAALGSKTRIYNEAKIRDIKTIGLVTKRFDQPRNSYHKIIKESFTRTLIDHLQEKELFKIVVLDTMENEKLDINTYVAGATIDAFLIAEWKLANPHSMVTDASVKLTLLDKKTKEVLLVSSHGTKFGNSYWWPPALPGTLLDATDGALNTMEKHLTSK